MDTFSVVSQSARLAGSEVGAGPAVVCIHAGVADRRSWFAVMDGLRANRRVLAYDGRSYGDTTYMPEPHSVVDDLLAVLDDRDIEAAVLVGCSKGGQLAYEMALRHRDRVTALVLIGSAPGGAPHHEAGANSERLFAAVEQAEAADDLELVNRLEAHLWLDGPDATEGRVGGAARDLFLDMNRRALIAPPPGDAAPLAGTWDELGRISVPTLLAVGALDLPPIVARMRQMAALIPGAELAVLEESAHLPMLDQPAALIAVIGRFLS